MTTILILQFASQQITIYFGLIILVTGIIGGILNIIIFTTLKSFRQTTCAFFLNIASIVNVIQLLTTSFVFIIAEGFYIDLDYKKEIKFYDEIKEITKTNLRLFFKFIE